MTALTSRAQGDLARTCLASSSVHWAAGLLCQTESAATSTATEKAKQSDCKSKLRITEHLELHQDANRQLHFTSAKIMETDTATTAAAVDFHGRHLTYS